MFLDRDGTLIRDVNYLTSVDQIEILPGVVEGIKLLRNDYLLLVVTNQSVVSRGMLSEQGLLEIHADLSNRLEREGASVDALYYCPHLPDDLVPANNQVCDCRKPRPGMLLNAARRWGLDMTQSYIVGDRNSDILAGKAASVKGILVKSEFAQTSDQIQAVAGLPEATQTILNEASI